MTDIADQIIDGKIDDDRDIKVRVDWDTDEREFFVILLLKSKRKNKSGVTWSRFPIQMKGHTDEQMGMMVQFAGAELAEYQNKPYSKDGEGGYGDSHDPSEISKLALEAYGEVMAKMAEDPDMPAKLKTLTGQ
jgi:hypothetical protein